jgi:hypothetical protein
VLHVEVEARLLLQPAGASNRKTHQKCSPSKARLQKKTHS